MPTEVAGHPADFEERQAIITLPFDEHLDGSKAEQPATCRDEKVSDAGEQCAHGRITRRGWMLVDSGDAKYPEVTTSEPPAHAGMLI